ncbi:MAG: chloride channel protein [Candidatus Heimdallarchaeota archaeon]|nr:chloride channel protein [Candidatus Heimdallarchaeota archaeon]
MQAKVNFILKYLNKKKKELQPDEFKLIYLSIVIGVIGGLGAIILRNLIDLIRKVFFEIPYHASNQSQLVTVLAPGLGGLFVGILIYYLADEARGHGVPEIIYAVNMKNGIMRSRVPFVKMITAALTIGSGGSAGREGPIAQIGGGMGSFIAQKMQLRPEDTKVLVLSGVAAGVAASFNAPLGGVLFALEVIPRDKKTHSMLPLIMSSVVGTTIGKLFLEENPAFVFPKENLITTQQIPINLHLFILLGIITGICAVIWVKGFYFIEGLIEKLPISKIILPAIGGICVGIIEIFYDEVNGTTYEPINNAFAVKLTLQASIIILIVKFIATSLSLGSGGSGGIFAPTLFEGVMIGSAFGLILYKFGYSGISIAIFAVLGMGGLFASSTRAPMTAIIMTSEMIGDFKLFIPLMFVVVTSWIVTRFFIDEDMYDIKLKRKGIVFRESEDFLENIVVADIMITKPITVHPKDRLETVISEMKTSGHTGFPVVENGHLFGIITEHDVNRALEEQNIKDWSVENACSKKIITTFGECPLSFAILKMTKLNVNRLPVVEHEDSTKIIGWITRSDVMKIYLQEKTYHHVSLQEDKLFEELDLDK